MSTTEQAATCERQAVEARLFDPGLDYDRACEVVAWCGGTAVDDGCEIDTPEGGGLASPGNWIVRGAGGEHWPVSLAVFAAVREDAGDVAPLAAQRDKARAEAAELRRTIRAIGNAREADRAVAALPGAESSAEATP